MTTEMTARCENLACLCEIPATEAACSDSCTSVEARDPQNVRCACGHPSCMEQQERQLHGGSGRESAG